MSDLERRILDALSEPGSKPLRPASLAKRLKLTKKELPEFRAALEKLLESRRLREGKKGRLRQRQVTGLIPGVVKRISSGAGFFVPHEAPPGAPVPDVYIEAADMRDAQSGDEVLVRLLQKRGRGGRRSGRVEEVLVRAVSTFVGTYLEREAQGYVQIDGRNFNEPVLVGDPGAKGALPGDKVVIDMLRFPSNVTIGEAVLTQVLGPRGAPGIDTLSIIHEFGLRDAFPEPVLALAREQAENFDENALGDRLDLTNETIITIDPVNARDFDDAISLSRSADGSWRLGVHIADVSHFVEQGSALDTEAKLRGTSVYLPDRVLPMLPEVLSNGLASLQKGKVRFTQSAFIEYTPEGVPVHAEFARSAIQVAWRFAYEDVMPVIEGRTSGRDRREIPEPIRELVHRMHGLAMILRGRRMAGGALDLSLREVKIDLDRQGAVTGAHEVEHDESHQIIEEFMLAANIAVATALSDRGIAFMRRSHADPDPLKLKALAAFVTVLGFPIKRFQSRREIQGLLNRVAGRPQERAVNYAVLRSLKQAEYTVADLGHYALGVQHYCHFTSPIRRYPDLAVHRTIADVLFDRKSRRGDHLATLEKLAKHCSSTERRAEQAERELIRVKLLKFMEDKIGDELDAVITGVERFGLFCQGIEIPVEGLIHISALDRNDYYEYDEAAFQLVGRKSGRHYQLGQHVRVCVVHVDVDRRELDFRLVDDRKASRKRKDEQAAPHRTSRTPRPKRSAKGGGAEDSNRLRAQRRERKKRRAERRGDGRGPHSGGTPGR